MMPLFSCDRNHRGKNVKGTAALLPDPTPYSSPTPLPTPPRNDAPEHTNTKGIIDTLGDDTTAYFIGTRPEGTTLWRGKKGDTGGKGRIVSTNTRAKTGGGAGVGGAQQLCSYGRGWYG